MININNYIDNMKNHGLKKKKTINSLTRRIINKKIKQNNNSNIINIHFKIVLKISTIII